LVKERRGKVKWRIVFDASSSESNSPSLNDVLEMSPKLLPEVFATLLRFLEHPVAVISDIQHAFLQLSLDRRDRDLTGSCGTGYPKTTRVTTTRKMR
jgi:hypothetical protein